MVYLIRNLKITSPFPSGIRTQFFFPSWISAKGSYSCGWGCFQNASKTPQRVMVHNFPRESKAKNIYSWQIVNHNKKTKTSILTFVFFFIWNWSSAFGKLNGDEQGRPDPCWTVPVSSPISPITLCEREKCFAKTRGNLSHTPLIFFYDVPLKV